MSCYVPDVGEQSRGARGEEPSTHVVPPVIVGGGDGLDSYRVEQYLPADLRLREGEAALVVIRGPSEGSVYRLGTDRVEIGRTGSEITLRHQTVSRRHAAVERVDSGFVLTDLASLNGLHVNGSRVERALLRHGDQVQIGLFKLLFVAPGH